jgi:hypothetical protein
VSLIKKGAEMTDEEFSSLKRFDTTAKCLEYSGFDRSTKGNAAYAYSLIFPDECIAVLGGKFDINSSSPYKSIIFTPVGCYLYDTGISHPRFFKKSDAIERAAVWNDLPHQPCLAPFRKLCELLVAYETWGGNSYLAKILKANPHLPVATP